MQYFSQFQQDKFCNETFFHHQKDLFFVDIGSTTSTNSNTLAFEKYLDWKGICVINPQETPKDRQCTYIEVTENTNLAKELKSFGCRRIDLLNIESNLSQWTTLVKTINFNHVYVQIICTCINNEIKSFLNDFGFRFVKTCGNQDIFINSRPDWTIYWNRDRHEVGTNSSAKDDNAVTVHTKRNLTDSIENVAKYAYDHNFNFCYDRLIPSTESQIYGHVLGGKSLIAYVYIPSERDATIRGSVLQQYANILAQQEHVRTSTVITAAIGDLNLLDKHAIVIHITVDTPQQCIVEAMKVFCSKCLSQRRPKLVIVKCADAYSQEDSNSVQWTTFDEMMCGIGFIIYRLYNNATVYMY